MDTLMLGSVEFVSDPQFHPLQPKESASSTALRSERMDLSRLIRETPYRVLTPRWLPGEFRLALAARQILLVDSSVVSVSQVYRGPAGNSAAISQTAKVHKMVVAGPFRETRVGAAAAAILAHQIPSSSGGVEILAVFWEVDGFLIRLQSQGLSEAELMRIGTSVE